MTLWSRRPTDDKFHIERFDMRRFLRVMSRNNGIFFEFLPTLFVDSTTDLDV